MTLTKRSGEIFFHYSQVSADVPDLRVGNDVEFLIENRKDKQVKTLALRVEPLPKKIRETINFCRTPQKFESILCARKEAFYAEKSSKMTQK